MTAKHHLVLVTDPMCSWCWGMADEFEKARVTLADQVTFDLMLGGINTHGTQPIGNYGRRFLLKLWREVQATTQQTFGFCLPDEYVHNSVLPCMAIEVMRIEQDAAPFDYLYTLQAQFFRDGKNINDIELLADVAEDFGVDRQRFKKQVREPVIQARVRFQFDHAKSFGTQALPSLLIEREQKLQLFAGGYVDAAMLTQLLMR